MFRRLRPRFPDGREKNTKTYWRTQPFIYNSSFFVYLRHQKKADKNSRNRLNRIDLTRWSNIYLPGELNKGTKRRGPTKEGDQHENLTKPAPYDFRFYGGIAIVWVKGRVRLVTPARLRSFFSLSLSFHRRTCCVTWCQVERAVCFGGRRRKTENNNNQGNARVVSMFGTKTRCVQVCVFRGKQYLHVGTTHNDWMANTSSSSSHSNDEENVGMKNLATKAKSIYISIYVYLFLLASFL